MTGPEVALVLLFMLMAPFAALAVHRGHKVTILGAKCDALNLRLTSSEAVVDVRDRRIAELATLLHAERARVTRHEDTIADLGEEANRRGNRIAALTLDLRRCETDCAELRADKARLGELLILALGEEDNVILLPDADSASRHPAGRS